MAIWNKTLVKLPLFWYNYNIKIKAAVVEWQTQGT